MSKRSPKGPVPSLIGGANGRPKLVLVQRVSKCWRCHEAIPSGRSCVAIPKLRGAYAAEKRVCDECFRRILEKTMADLEELAALVAPRNTVVEVCTSEGGRRRRSIPRA